MFVLWLQVSALLAEVGEQACFVPAVARKFAENLEDLQVVQRSVEVVGVAWTGSEIQPAQPGPEGVPPGVWVQSR